MQIKQISLYGKNKQRRDVKFETSKLNIITGASKKGKTSLLDIVEYCLGASECDVAAGHIRNTVSWFSVLFQFETTQVFVARKAPNLGSKSSSETFLLAGDEVEIPEANDIKGNTTIESALSFLSSKLGFPEYKTEVPDQQTRSQINISFKHLKYFLFQSQDEIANKKSLFHRQSEPFIMQTIKDILPYFLGAADDNRFYELERLRELKRSRNIKQKELNEIESLKGEGLSKGFTLLAEAAQVGLYRGSTFSISDKALIEELVKVSEWIPENEVSEEANKSVFEQLDCEFNELREEKRIVNIYLKEAEEFQAAFTGYQKANHEQTLRLQTLNLFEKLEASNSPVKGKILSSLETLSKSLENTVRSKPKISSKITELKIKRADLAKSIKKNQVLLYELQKEDKVLSDLKGENIKRAKVVGRISLYLDGINWNTDSSILTRNIRELTEKINELEERLDPELLAEKLDSQLNLIGNDMTRWARELKLEHSDCPIKLDLKRLTVIAETPEGKVPLYQMGSGENWVGYHLVTFMALAKWFKHRDRPTPRFVIFDQPTQVYFPTDVDVTGDIGEIEVDEDRLAVKQMFKWLNDLIINEFNSEFQIIVTDHADIDEEWFQDCVQDKKWRGQEALIPQSWINHN